MKIVIDTKEDIHILRHIINMLHAITGNVSPRRFDSDYSNSMFDSTSSSSSSQSTPPVSDASGLFGMFDSSSSSSSPSSSFSDTQGPFEEPKKDSNKRDFIDSLQVY